jgi:hypothetical protein
LKAKESDSFEQPKTPKCANSFSTGDVIKLRERGHGGVIQVLVGWAREIAEFGPLAIGVELFFDGGDGAEDEVGGVGHAGGATRGDAVLGLEAEEAGKEFVDSDSGLKVSQAVGEGRGEVHASLLVLRELSLASAEDGFRICDKHAAARSVEEAMLAAAVREFRRPGGDGLR